MVGPICTRGTKHALRLVMAAMLASGCSSTDPGPPVQPLPATPNGWIYYTKLTKQAPVTQTIWRVRPDGTDNHEAFRPDGWLADRMEFDTVHNRVAYLTVEGILVVPLAAPNEPYLAISTGGFYTTPRIYWTPDGKALLNAYSHPVAPPTFQSREDLRITQADGSGERTVLMGEIGHYIHLVGWFPGGDSLLYTSSAVDTAMVLRLSDGGHYPYLPLAGEYIRALSPSGRVAVGVSRDPGEPQISIVRIYELSSGRVLREQTVLGIDRPNFAPDDRHLVYGRDYQLLVLDTETMQEKVILEVDRDIILVSYPVWVP